MDQLKYLLFTASAPHLRYRDVLLYRILPSHLHVHIHRFNLSQYGYFLIRQNLNFVQCKPQTFNPALAHFDCAEWNSHFARLLCFSLLQT